MLMGSFAQSAASEISIDVALGSGMRKVDVRRRASGPLGPNFDGSDNARALSTAV